ncbi:MAG: DUF2147 domain-containing protein [Roseivirga sp.]|nr:DUF2147 domain-containing protein [Roseivirga sp.]
MKYLFLSFYSLVFLIPQAAAINNDGDEILGLWLTDDKRAKIEIYKVGEEYSGKIVWIYKTTDDNGNPILDDENPDEELRKKPILGLNLIKGFTYEKGKWVDGSVYDPDNGKTYDCVMKLKGNRLEVRGYIGFTMFGRTVVWTKAE